MFTNARIVIARPGTTYDQTTGNRTEGTDTTVLDAPCVFSQQRSGRRVKWDDLQSGVIVEEAVIVHGHTDADVRTGDVATVTFQGVSRTFEVVKATLTPGVAETHWEIALRAPQTP